MGSEEAAGAQPQQEEEEERVFWCNTCKVYAAQSHFSSEWHKFNLNRKVDGLPPYSEAAFVKTMEGRASEDVSVRAAAWDGMCNVCNKRYASVKAYEQHCRSKKHRARERLLAKDTKPPVRAYGGEDSSSSGGGGSSSSTTRAAMAQSRAEEEAARMAKLEAEMTARMEALDVCVEACLFCEKKSASLEANLRHMAREHSFAIPDLHLLHDIEGLVGYLQQKVMVGYTCLFCDKSFHSLQAVRGHMIDKNHTNMAYSGKEDEYAMFYVGAQGDEGEWEDVDGMEELTDEELAQLEASGQLTLLDDDSEYSGALSTFDAQAAATTARGNITYEMVLTGKDGASKVVGHRSLRHVYKQRVRVRSEQQERVLAALSNAYAGMGLVRAQRATTRLPAEVRAIRQKFQERRAHSHMALGIKGNKVNQHHFRAQVLV